MGDPLIDGPSAALRRLMLLHVSAPMFAEFLKGGIGSHTIADRPLPADAIIVDVAWDLAHEVITLKVESATFPSVPEDARIPEMDSPLVRWAAAVKATEAEASRN